MEFVKLKNLCSIFIGKDKPQDKFSKIRTDELNIPIYGNGTTEESMLLGFTNKTVIKKPCVTVSVYGSCAGFVKYQEQFFYPAGRINCFTPNEKLNVKYLYYFLNFYIPPNLTTHGAIPRVASEFLANILIPLPLLNQQQKIVNFLDKWTALINDLETEQVKRTEQFNFYLNRIFKNINNDTWDTLEHLTNIQRGDRLTKTQLRENTEKNYLFFGGGVNPMGYWKDFNTDKNTVTVINYGTAGFVGYTKEKIWAGDVLFRLFNDETKLLNRFLYFYLLYRQGDLYNAVRGSIPCLSHDVLKDFPCPVMDLKQQQEIIKKIDVLHTLTFDDLPKEIELRKQQYQHYLNTIFQHLI